MQELKGIEEKFIDNKVYNLYSIGQKLGVCRMTLIKWIHEGVNKNIIRNDRVYKTKLKLKAQLIGGCWKALGINIKSFIRDRQDN